MRRRVPSPRPRAVTSIAIPWHVPLRLPSTPCLDRFGAVDSLPSGQERLEAVLAFRGFGSLSATQQEVSQGQVDLSVCGEKVSATKVESPQTEANEPVNHTSPDTSVFMPFVNRPP